MMLLSTVALAPLMVMPAQPQQKLQLPTRRVHTVSEDAQYLNRCCNRAWNAYGRYARTERKARRRPKSPAQFFNGPPPRSA